MPEVSLVATDVLDSLSSVVVLGEALLSGSECEIVEPHLSPEGVKRSVWRVKKT